MKYYKLNKDKMKTNPHLKQFIHEDYCLYNNSKWFFDEIYESINSSVNTKTLKNSKGEHILIWKGYLIDVKQEHDDAFKNKMEELLK